MRIFNFHLMTDARFRAEKRRSEKFGHRRALADFQDADKIVYRNYQVLNGMKIQEKLVLLGDYMLVANNIFTGSETMLEIH